MPDREPSVTSVFWDLVAGTDQIVDLEYFYFCTARESEDKVKRIAAADELTFALMLRPVRIATRDQAGPLCLEPIRPNTAADNGDHSILNALRRTGSIVSKNGRKKKTDGDFDSWKKQYFDDFKALDSAFGKSQSVDCVCVPEFGLPFPVGHDRGPYFDPKGAGSDRNWTDLLALPIMKRRFVCLGSAYREYADDRIEPGSEDQLETFQNIAYLYPSGTDCDGTIDMADIAQPAIQSETIEYPDGWMATIKAAGDGQIACRIDGPDVKIPNRKGVTTDRNVFLDNDEFKKLKRMRPEIYERVRDAFRFQSQIADRQPGTDEGAQFLVYKQNAAKHLGEYLERPRKSKLEVFVTPKGVIAVLICYDAFDPTTFLASVRAQRDGQFNHPSIDIFFVPAFNKSPRLIEMCRGLSKLSNSVVVYVSSHPGAKADDRYRVFIGGDDVQNRKYWEAVGWKSVDGFGEIPGEPLTKTPVRGAEFEVLSLKGYLVNHALRRAEPTKADDPDLNSLGLEILLDEL